MGFKSQSDLNKSIDVVQDKIKSNQDILKLLKYNANEIDIYQQPELSRSEAEDITRNNILTYAKDFDDNNMCCYMILSYGDKNYHKRSNSFFNGSTFDFRVLCHNDIVKNKYVGNRVNEIEQIIFNIFDGKPLDGTGFGCKVVNSKPIYAKNTNYEGRHIQIAFFDFNGDK